MNDINLLAVLVAAISSFFLGGLWYSPVLFGKTWMAETGVKGDEQHPAKVFGTSFIFTLISAFVFAQLLGSTPELMHSIEFGLYVGLGFVATSLGINYQFSNKSFRLLLIDAGYHIGQFVIYGAILGAWH
ncbi:MAG: DUF1761 domain-containing protein [Psychrobium sp.]